MTDKLFRILDRDGGAVLLDTLARRSRTVGSDILTSVSKIIEQVREGGDEALLGFCEKYDGVRPDPVYIPDEVIDAAEKSLSAELRTAIGNAAANIRAFHEIQLEKDKCLKKDGAVIGQRIMPLSRVGIYIPGGTAAYPSTVLMNAIPAAVAGVKDIIMATPPKKDGVSPAVLYAAKLAGVGKIINIGGAQAIAALAYGTESIKRVDKIVGPGNMYVAAAKRLVYGAVDIDMIAGPSEILIIADNTANPAFVAADMMSQAEHDPVASAILITTDPELPARVEAEMRKMLPGLSRRSIIEKSLCDYGFAITVGNINEAVCLSEEIAPEHLELCVAHPFTLLEQISNAGSVFLGNHTPEPLADYYAGPNHVLPTNGTARFSSSLSVASFLKRSTYLMYEPSLLEKDAADVIRFAEAEGFDAHANSISVRVAQKVNE